MQHLALRKRPGRPRNPLNKIDPYIFMRVRSSTRAAIRQRKVLMKRQGIQVSLDQIVRDALGLVER